MAMSQRGRSLLDWVRIYALPISVVLLGLMLSVGVFYWLRSSRDRQIRRRFAVLAGSQLENLESKIDSYSSILQLITDFYHSSQTVTRYKFQSITKGVLKRHKELSSIQWLPAISTAEKDDYLSSLREEGFKNVNISTINPKNGNERQDTAGRSYPVTYVEPTLPGQKAGLIGIDYLSTPDHRSLLEKTAKQNLITAILSSPALKTLSSSDTSSSGPRVFILLKAVYEGGHFWIKDRWETLGGFIALEIPHEVLMETVFPPEKTSELKLFVYGNTKNSGNKLLYAESESGSPTPAQVGNWWTFRQKISIGDKSLTVLVNPGQDYLSQRRTAYPWVVLFLGIGVTVLLGRGSYQLSGQYLSQEKQFYSIFDNAPYAIATLDAEGRFRLWNDSAREMFGYSESEARGRELGELLHSGDDDGEAVSVESLLEDTTGGEDFREVEATTRDGETFPINLGIRKWELQGMTFYTLMAEDITERKKYQRKIERMARRDNLTDLFNRGTFMEKLSEEYQRVERYDQDLSVIMMDVDHFKDVNDTHGHLVGDEILKGIADTLKEDSRATDFPARYGGEEFCVALPETSLDKARGMAERLRKHIQESEYSEGVRVTCSIGVAEYDESVEDLDDLLNRADEALYQSKESGRNRTSVWDGE